MAQTSGAGVASVTAASLTSLPDEVLAQIFSHVSLEDNVIGLQRVSRRFASVADEPALWRTYCFARFKYWHPRHFIVQRVERIDWKRLFLDRISCNKRIAALLDDIIAKRDGRSRRVGEIGRLGFDAADFLLRQTQADPSSEDGLARRYYSKAILSSIYKDQAIAEWVFLRDETGNLPPSKRPVYRLERAVGAFDSFLSLEEPYDVHAVTLMLHQITAEFRKENPDFYKMTTRQKVYTLSRWLRWSNMIGLHVPGRVDDMKTLLFGHTLRQDGPRTIPAIAGTIFCAVAMRLGLDARYGGFPAVFPPPGFTLDGSEAKPGKAPRCLFIDAYGICGEVLNDPRFMSGAAAELDVPWDQVFDPMDAADMLRRMVNHLKAYGRGFSRWNSHVPELNFATFRDCEYAWSWAEHLFGWFPSLEERRAKLVDFMENSIQYWPEDAWLFEKYLGDLTRGMKAQMAPPLPPIHQQPYIHRWNTDEQAAAQLPFQVGQIIAHKRYRRRGVITGWAKREPLPPRPANEVVQFSRSDRSRPPPKPPAEPRIYYTYLANDLLETHIISTSSMAAHEDPQAVDPSTFPAAGRYFLRFDKETGRFIPNKDY